MLKGNTCQPKASPSYSDQPWTVDPLIPNPIFWPNHLTINWVSHWADFKVTKQGIIWLYYESFRHDVQYFLGYKIPLWQWDDWSTFQRLKPLFKKSLAKKLSKDQFLSRHTAEWLNLPVERTKYSKDKIDQMFREDLLKADINRVSAWGYYKAVQWFGKGAFFD